MVSRMILSFLILTISSLSAAATTTACAVSERTADGFLNLRIGPGNQFNIIGIVRPNDFLWVASEPCRSDFGSLQCDETNEWVFVERVFPFRSDARDAAGARKGWAHSRYIRYIACDDGD